MGADNNIQYKLSDQTVNINIAVLEDMKQALISFFSKPEDEFPTQYLEHKDGFKQEIEASAAMILEGTANIGVWKLEIHNDRLVFVRYPDYRPNMRVLYLFHATMSLIDQKWYVASFHHVKISGLHK